MTDTAHSLLANLFDEEEAREVAEAIVDDVMDHPQGISIEIRWAIEEAVMTAFGYTSDHDAEVDR